MRRPMTLALSLLGLYVSLYLLYTYTSPSRPMVCIGTGCDAVRASAYSTLGGVSMPVFGVLGYILLSLVVIAESLFPARAARLARRAFLGMTGFGFLFSLYLEYLQAFVIRAYCAWCMTSGVVMTALFALAIVNLVRSGPEPEPSTQLAQVRSLFAICVAGAVVGAPAFYLLARHGEVAPEASQVMPSALASQLVRPGIQETGNRQAPLTVVEFGDFECPVCGRGEAAAREIRARYARQIRFVFRQFPLERIHPLAQKAAEASECAGEQGEFWEMVEKIYSRQDDLSLQGLERDAAELSLDQPRFDQCLAGGAMAGRVRRDVEDGRALGVRATPTFFIGQQRVEGVLTAAQFSQLVDGRLAGLGLAASDIEPGVPPAAVAARKVATNTPVPRNLPKVPAPNALAPRAPNTSGADPGRPLIGFPTAAPGGLAGGWQGTAPTGLFGSAPGGAACSEADAAKPQPALIDTPALRHLLTGNAKPLFVDVRPAGDYAAGHISGAINLPADDIGRQWNTLPKDRTIILYESGRSSGDVCAASRSAGRTLLEHGLPFSQIKVYRDGLVGWERAGMGLDQ
ncbi:MAG: thioredoxin domain-containing protein [Bryobacteraceae bacterium]